MQHSRQLLFRLVQETAVFAFLSSSILCLYRQNWVLLAVLCLCLTAVLWQWHRRSDVVSLIVIASLGSMAEVVFVRFGVWQYANPSFLGVPIWFPIAFGLAGLVGQRLSVTIRALWAHVADTKASN
jgi:uncharacterized membrane protein YoaT (DUF817 family)